MTNDSDHRVARHDPASKRTHDSNDRKRGKIDEAEASPDQIAAADAGKFNTRDDGRGKATTDDPLEFIKKR